MVSFLWCFKLINQYFVIIFVIVQFLNYTFLEILAIGKGAKAAMRVKLLQGLETGQTARHEDIIRA